MSLLAPYDPHDDNPDFGPDFGPGMSDGADGSPEHSIREHGAGQYHDLEGPHRESEHYLDWDHFGGFSEMRNDWQGGSSSGGGVGCAMMMVGMLGALFGSLPAVRQAHNNNTLLSKGGCRS